MIHGRGGGPRGRQAAHDGGADENDDADHAQSWCDRRCQRGARRARRSSQCQQVAVDHPLHLCRGNDSSRWIFGTAIGDDRLIDERHRDGEDHRRQNPVAPLQARAAHPFDLPGLPERDPTQDRPGRGRQAARRAANCRAPYLARRLASARLVQVEGSTRERGERCLTATSLGRLRPGRRRCVRGLPDRRLARAHPDRRGRDAGRRAQDHGCAPDRLSGQAH